MDSLELLVRHYGYFALVIGTLLEGETILILAGFMAHQGYLNFFWVVTIGFFCTLFADQFFFFWGRRQGSKLLQKHPRWQPRVDKIHRLMARYQRSILISFRFLYGLRTIIPIVIGMSQITSRQFLFYNTVSAILWAVIIGGSGYLFGHVLDLIIIDIEHYEQIIFLLLIGGGFLFWFIRVLRARRTGKKIEMEEEEH